MVSVSLNVLDATLDAIADRQPTKRGAAVDELVSLGLVNGGDTLALSDLGERYFRARFVIKDSDAARQAIGEAVGRHPVATAFLEGLWGQGQVPVAGALRLLRRLTGSSDEVANRRWLELMNRGGLIVYNRANSTMRVLANPASLKPPDEAARGERERGHSISPKRPYGNMLALADLLRSARGWICWYEQHMPAKALEVLYRETDGAVVSDIRLLSGPANVDDRLRSEFKRFKAEMESGRGISVAWRVLSKDEARGRHDRYFLSEGLSRNLPPLNSIFANSSGEILPSEMTVAEFGEWWMLGEDLLTDA